MPSIVKIENISKKYLIHHEKQGAYSTLVDTLTKKAKRGLHSFRNFLFSNNQFVQTNKYEEFWALQNINLEIEEGDRVGIIGRNGAGKSTLLKVISRITEPTTGRISIKGRVASLLEVGTGFHLELSGRENIFLNGAILGMSNQEIKKKFDEIVAFADIEKFLDTPVKQFSSGMHTRLGFAIAAHLDPDLLIVDEVLAVGDILFQQKCLKKLNDLSSHGRTILFVSHDIGSILTFCNKGILLEKGCLQKSGLIDECVGEYMKSLKWQSLEWKGNDGDEHARFYQVSLRAACPDREFFYRDEKVLLTIDYEILKLSQGLFLGIGIWNPYNQLLASSYTFDQTSDVIRKGRCQLTFEIDTHLFYEGEYIIKLDCGLHNRKKIISDQINLKLTIYESSKQTQFTHATAREGIYLGNGWSDKK